MMKHTCPTELSRAEPSRAKPRVESSRVESNNTPWTGILLTIALLLALELMDSKRRKLYQDCMLFPFTIIHENLFYFLLYSTPTPLPLSEQIVTIQSRSRLFVLLLRFGPKPWRPLPLCLRLAHTFHLIEHCSCLLRVKCQTRRGANNQDAGKILYCCRAVVCCCSSSRRLFTIHAYAPSCNRG
mmetsp:Transcript_1169/g.2018  ORF Transcript_1169/g.2018 Transcript_1169/m.2018 type:complete len:184 (+) Transcript_1169:99-650(+)